MICTQCRAFYHPECWKYNGSRCAIFGCGNQKDPPPKPDQTVEDGPAVRTPGNPPVSAVVAPSSPTVLALPPSARQTEIASPSSFARGLAGIAVAVGIVQGLIVFSFLSNGGSLEKPLYVNPLRTILDLFLSAYPLLWFITLAPELRRIRKLVVNIGSVVLILWGLGLLGRMMTATTPHNVDSSTHRSNDAQKTMDSSPSSAPTTERRLSPTVQERPLAPTKRSPANLPKLEDLPSLPELPKLDNLPPLPELPKLPDLPKSRR